MKITSVNNNNINFGYDAAYHEQLHEKLENKKTNKAMAQQLLEADYFALELEDEIVRLENEKKTRSKEYANLIDMLLDIREVFAKNIEKIFPEIHYSKDAADIYIIESKKAINNTAIFWREYISGTLDDCRKTNMYKAMIKAKNKASQQAENTVQQPKEEELKKAFKETLDKVQAAQATPVIHSSIINLYEPNMYSPKSLDDVAGMDEIKERLRNEVIAYLKNPELEELDFQEYGIRAPRGFLLYGPPGCGKTYIASAVAAESDIQMYKMDLSKIGSKYVNETSNNIQKAFDMLANHVKSTGEKVILFMDEVDSLAMNRSFNFTSSGENEKTTTALLKNIETARDKGIIVFAATNRFDSLDEAFKSRFDGQYYIGLPDIETTEKLVKMELSKKQKGQVLAQNEEEISRLAKLFKGHSNRSIVMILDEAGKLAKKDNRSDITSYHVEKAIKESELEKPNEKNYISQSKKAKTTLGFNVTA